MVKPSAKIFQRVVIRIKLEFGASVRFIHKESVSMHGHTIVKKLDLLAIKLHLNIYITFTNFFQVTVLHYT